MAGKIHKSVVIAVGVIAGFQMFFAIAMCVCCFIFAGKTSDAFAPFWSAVPLLFSACLGIAGAITRNQCVIVAWLVIDIFLTLILFIGAALTGIASALFGLAVEYIDNYGCKDSGDNCVCYKSSNHNGGTATFHGMSCDNIEMVHSLLQALTAFGILSAFSTLAASICSCVALCCFKNQPQPVIITSGQNVVVSNYPPLAANNGYPPPAANNGYPPHAANNGYPPFAENNGYPPHAENNGYPPQEQEKPPPPYY